MEIFVRICCAVRVESRSYIEFPLPLGILGGLCCSLCNDNKITLQMTNLDYRRGIITLYVVMNVVLMREPIIL